MESASDACLDLPDYHPQHRLVVYHCAHVLALIQLVTIGQSAFGTVFGRQLCPDHSRWGVAVMGRFLHLATDRSRPKTSFNIVRLLNRPRVSYLPCSAVCLPVAKR